MKYKMMAPSVLALTFLFTSSASATDVRPIDVVRIQTTDGDPSSLATAPNGDIWIADWSKDYVQLFSKDASGTTSPLKTIALYASGGQSSSTSDASSIAVDANGFLYVADASVNKIYVFNPSLGENQFLGDALRTINLGHRARTIALDSSGRIYAAGKYNSKLEVRIFSAGTTNDSNAPIQTFTDSSTTSTDEPYGLTVLASGELAVAWWAQPDIRIYSSTSSGDVRPLRTISGVSTSLGNLGQLVSDSLGRLYVWNDDLRTLQIFAPEADGNVAPIASIGFYAISADSIPSVINWGWGLTLGKNSQIWVGTANTLIHFNNPFTIQEIIVTPPANTDASAAAHARQEAVLVAKSEVRNVLAAGKALTAEQLLQADFVGVTAKNIGLVNADIAKLPEIDRRDIKQLEKIVLKFATVDKVAEGKNLYSSELVAVGLISPESKIKTTILAALKKQPQSSLDSFEKIQAAIATAEKTVADRKARLAALLAKRR